MDFGESFCGKVYTLKLRQRNSTIFFITLLACLVAMFVTTPVLAQSPGYTDFSSGANLTTLGNAQVPVVNVNKANVLRLTPDQTSQVGAAWFNIKQPVANGFTTTFTFQLTHAGFPADGIAFVIQNAPAPIEGPNTGGLAAIGPGGGYLGYDGIPNSLAVEFDTFNNGALFNDPNANHVAVQSCGTSPNSVVHSGGDVAGCQLAINSNLVLPGEGFLSDGNQHTAEISYTPPAANCVECSGTLTVTLDGVSLFPEGVLVNLATLLNLDNGTAFVGFTGGTGAFSENNDILSWNFAPTTITQPAPAGQFTVYNFGSYLYKVRPNQNIDALSVTAVETDPATFAKDRNNLNNFPGSQCIVYSGTAGKCVEFHAACNSPSNGACANVNYDVVTSYDVPAGPPITNPGFLKATGLDCNPGIAFDANIITAFFQTRTDPTTKGSSKPTFSCFVAVQNVSYSPADVDIANVASPKVVTGSNLTYLIPVANFGPNAAQGVNITDNIPAGTSYVSSGLCSLTSGCSSTQCSAAAGAVTCTVGSMDPFSVQVMVVVVHVNAPAGTVLKDTASSTAFNPDPRLADNVATATTLVVNKR